MCPVVYTFLPLLPTPLPDAAYQCYHFCPHIAALVTPCCRPCPYKLSLCTPCCCPCPCKLFVCTPCCCSCPCKLSLCTPCCCPCDLSCCRQMYPHVYTHCRRCFPSEFPRTESKKKHGCAITALNVEVELVSFSCAQLRPPKFHRVKPMIVGLRYHRAGPQSQSHR